MGYTGNEGSLDSDYLTSIGQPHDGGGNPFVLDQLQDPPTVYACIHDEDFGKVLVAPTFEDFIDRLDLDPDMI